VEERAAYLRANSRLPGPRANLELLASAAEEVDLESAIRWAGAALGSDPTDVFVIMVGLVGLGRFAGAGDETGLAVLRRRAADAEWRIREAVAIGLQRLGDERPERLAEIARAWTAGSALEARAAVAAVAEPRLLRSPNAVSAALEVMDAATAKVADATDGRAPDVRVLRQALGYAWSVVVAADPPLGWPRLDAWAARAERNPDIDWILRENRGKSRLRRLRPC
jgi:hypothetical protein